MRPLITSPSAVRALAIVLFGALQGAGAAPFQSARAPEQIRDRDLQVVEDRHRGELHPGNPLVVVGLFDEGAGNDFREGLRAAARGPYEPARVDADEAYRRRVAMYESGLDFDRSLRRTDRETPRASDRQQPIEEETPRKREPYDTTWIGLLLAAAATVGIYVTRGR